MRVLIVGTGGVGEAIAAIARRRDPQGEWLEKMVLSDYNLAQAQEVSHKLGDPTRFPCEQLDAKNKNEIITIAKKHKINLIMNACDPSFDMIIFDAAYDCDCTYMDMAMSLSVKHPLNPYGKCHVMLGDEQFGKAKAWEEKGLLAILGSGVEPGMADVFARYAEKHFFDEIEEIGIRDGNNLSIEGYDLAFGFSIWTTIEECLNPPVVWERDKGWYTTEPFSDPEIFYLPEGIGDVEMVNVEHEEVILIPKYIDKGLKKVTFKFGLGQEFINALRYLQSLNLDRADMQIKIGNVEISPRDFIAKVAPNPAKIGKLMKGKTCAGTWVKGKKNGLYREIYLYQVADNKDCVDRLDCQSVVAQTAFSPVLMMELLAKGIWKGTGVHGPEAFDPDPFIQLMEYYEFPPGFMEMESEYLHALGELQLRDPVLYSAATKEISK